MSLKTAWLNLQDGLGNRFAWSHVNAIYYSQAQNKLLKDKLDDMETAINAKVAKTDIVQVESTSQSTVPSSAYLKSVKDDLDSEINTLSSGTINTIDIGPITTDNSGRFTINYSYRKAIAINLLSTENYAVIRYLNDTQSLVYVFSLYDHSPQKAIETRGTLFYLSI